MNFNMSEDLANVLSPLFVCKKWEDIMLDYTMLAKDANKIYRNSLNIENGNIKHNTIQNEICELSQKYGYTFKKEFIVHNFRGEKSNGKIDVVWHKDGSPSVAFEIDSSVREKSIGKLLLFNGEKIWIYYGNKMDKFKRKLNESDKNNEIKIIRVS